MTGLRWRRMFAVVISFAMVCSLFIPVVGQAGEPIQAGEFEEYQIAEGKYGMVSTSHPLATEVGADILQQGGNAVDAAVAVQLALNVVEPPMSGIGGGGFMMVYEAGTDEVTIINSRERAPAGAEPDMFLNDDGGIIPFPERSTSGSVSRTRASLWPARIHSGIPKARRASSSHGTRTRTATSGAERTKRLSPRPRWPIQ
jgi:gamma-glutamyltranspeptidase / glutathione hydrolase